MSSDSHRDVVERMPAAMSARPRDHRGYPVPWFTPWHEGRWDFRFIEDGKVQQAVREERCWTCGQPLGSLPVAFVIGPMCAVNRTSAEPPSHVQCAIYAAKACPFLARPKMQRPSSKVEGIDDSHAGVPGVMIDRNPGVALVWVTNHPTYQLDVKLFDIGDAVRVRWYARSRPATRAEVIESIDSGLPILRDMAQREGPDALAELQRATSRAMELVPA